MTPRADLYSLGAMLYEMCTGRVPFMGDDDIGIISQHINTPPVAPSWHNNQIPKTLDSLILRLLAKDPSERPDSADEVLAALNAVDLTAVEEREEESTGSLDAMAGGVFVGRHREMDQLKSIFEDVLSGRGRMVMLAGEPGIGKTRTAQELATYAGMRGATVLWGRNYEGGGAPPYWPWVQAIRSHVTGTERQALRDQLDSTAPVIAELVSDVKAKLLDVPAPTQIEDPDSARFRLFDSISTFLKNISVNQPLVLMLEDLHWSDKPSLMLLEFIARELTNSRILIVGNYRDMELNRRHPLSVTLGDLTRERLFERVVLRGLQKHDVQRFIEIAAGIAPPAALVDTVHSQTEGNPLFVTETVRLLIQEGDITSGQSTKGGTTSWEIRIPEGVREVIGRRLDRLSERCNVVLTTAAVIGRQFRFPVILNLIDEVSESMLLDVMDEALDARVVEELPEEVGLYQFTHALMQETLTSELALSRRVRLHAHIAEALEAHYGDEAEQHAAELAEHFAEAEAITGSDRATEYFLLAGEHSLHQHAFEQAIAQFERGIDFKETNTLDSVSVALEFGRARAMAAVIQREETEDVVKLVDQLVANHIAKVEINEACTAAMIHIVPISAARRQRRTHLSEVFERILPHLEDESHLEASLLARYGAALVIERADFDRSNEAIERALELANANDDWEAKMEALDSRLTYFTQSADWEALGKLGEIYREQAIQNSSPSKQHRGLQTIGIYANTLGDFKKMKIVTTEMQEISDFVSPTFNRIMEDQNGLINLALGEWDQAASDDDIQWGSGAFYFNDSAAQWITEGTASKPLRDLDPAFVFQMVSFGLPVGSDADTVLREAMSEGLEQLSLPKLTDQYRPQIISSVIEIATFLEEKTTVSTMHPMLERFAGQTVPFGLHNIDRILGQSAGLLEHWTQAIEHFEVAIEKTSANGQRPEYAFTCYGYSTMLLDRNDPGDREKAIELQDEAISIATELGMKPLLERVLAKRKILKA